jgi:hypothetical protein
MRKLKLDLTDLEVTTFATDRTRQEQLGTVAAHKLPAPTTLDPTCGDLTCDPYQGTCDYYTCAESCYGTCANQCGGSYHTECAICLID